MPGNGVWRSHDDFDATTELPKNWRRGLGGGKMRDLFNAQRKVAPVGAVLKQRNMAHPRAGPEADVCIVY
jgi:hypothetical protein